MTGFSITLSEASFELDGGVFALGSLSLGTFQEDFHVSLSYWDRGRYLAQWREGLSRLVKGESHSAVVTSMYDSRIANFIFWWPMYAIGDSIHVQNQILFLDELEQPFDEADPYRSISNRRTEGDEGERISEWIIKRSDIQAALARLPLESP